MKTNKHQYQISHINTLLAYLKLRPCQSVQLITQVVTKLFLLFDISCGESNKREYCLAIELIGVGQKSDVIAYVSACRLRDGLTCNMLFIELAISVPNDIIDSQLT